MIFYYKLGIVGLIIPFVFAFLFQMLLGDEASNAGIGYILGATLVWFLGKKWNAEVNSQNEFDPNSNYRKHSLFWIDLEYWGFVFGVIGLSILIKENIYDLGTNLQVIIWGIAITAIAAIQIRKNISIEKGK